MRPISLRSVVNFQAVVSVAITTRALTTALRVNPDSTVASLTMRRGRTFRRHAAVSMRTYGKALHIHDTRNSAARLHLHPLPAPSTVLQAASRDIGFQ